MYSKNGEIVKQQKCPKHFINKKEENIHISKHIWLTLR